MSNLVIETTYIKIYEYLHELCKLAGVTQEWGDELWNKLLTDDELFKEFIYYLENHTFKDEIKIKGYSLSDLYVFQLDKYNLVREIGKNPTTCNKETMVLNAFYMMASMKEDPEKCIKRLESGWGNDML